MTAGGNFFAVDRRCVEAVCAQTDGLTLGVAYLVLARFASGKNHSSTRAGMTVLHNRLSLSRGRSDLALKTLEGAGFISSSGRGGTRKIASWAERQAEAAGLSDKQRAVLARVRGKKDPIISASDPDYQSAYALMRKGALVLTDAPQGKPKFRAPEPDYLFLPNALVDGFREWDLPLTRLRQIGDVRAFETLMRVYQHANLPEDGGLPVAMIRERFDRFEVARWGEFTVWAFKRANYRASWDPFITPFTRGRPDAEKETLTQEFWSVWQALISARLVEHVGYIMECAGISAQPMHPFTEHTGTEEEREVSVAAAEAARRIANEAQIWRAMTELDEGRPLLCPVLSHILDVQLVGIARPMHRANTSRTRAWVRNYLHRCAGYTAIFAELGQNQAQSTA